MTGGVQAGGTRTGQVTDAIREFVRSGALPPGARLQEIGLAKRLGVSRTPVREALRVLGAEGLLDHSPHCGYVVRRMSLQDVLDVFDVRATLEAMACRIVAERSLPADLADGLRADLAAGEALTAGPDWSPEHEQRWGVLNDRFHGRLLDATGNRALIEAVRQMGRIPLIHGLEGQPHDALALRRTYGDRLHCQRSLADHVLILEAIIDRQSSRAEHLMREHIYRNRDGFRQVVEQICAERSSAAA